jgi:NAD(P)-dependent dehydrogenase (short-subunit alcohol dehydrogenase family)
VSELGGRRALVTGASRGIGLAIASRLAAAGASVAVNSIDRVEAEDAAARIRAAGGDAIAVAADVASPAQVEAMVRAVDSWRGPVEILVNNAGILEMAPLVSMDPGLWHRVVDVNLGGTVGCTIAVLPAMRASGWGRIVNVASYWGIVGVAGATHYCASKGGIVAFTQAAARSLSESGIRVLAVAPGTVDTAQLGADAAFAGISLDEMREAYGADTVVGRIATADEIAALVEEALHDSEALNGTTIIANGGRRIA